MGCNIYWKYDVGEVGQQCISIWHKSLKISFMFLGTMLKGSGAPVVFSSVLPAGEGGSRKRRQIEQVNEWLRSRCLAQGLSFPYHLLCPCACMSTVALPPLLNLLYHCPCSFPFPATVPDDYLGQQGWKRKKSSKKVFLLPGGSKLYLLPFARAVLH